MKNFSPLSEIEELKLIYHDVVNGYSLYHPKKIYVKHFSEDSYARILLKKSHLILSYKDEGLPSTSQREEEIIKENLWSQDREDRILQLKYLVSDNEKYAQGMMIPYQKNAILEMVNKHKRELLEILREKDGVLGPTCEKLAERESENFFIQELFFKDEGLKTRCFSEEEMEDLEYEELREYKEILNAVLARIGEADLEKIACLPFFLNSLSIIKERPECLFDNKISRLTFNQHSLLTSGLRNLNIGSQTEGSPPSLIDGSVDDLVRWYTSQYSILLGKSGKGGTGGGLTVTSKDVVKN